MFLLRSQFLLATATILFAPQHPNRFCNRADSCPGRYLRRAEKGFEGIVREYILENPKSFQSDPAS